uniref:Uncharacterized protein n=1 Tax=Anguilla anguilla TaxID=7936 RepID=A0A0E9XSG3_ANGAN
MTGRLLFTSCSNTSTSELLKFFLHLESGSPPSLDFCLGIIDFALNFSFQYLCAHGPAVSCPFMGTSGAFTYEEQMAGAFHLRGQWDSSL